MCGIAGILSDNDEQRTTSAINAMSEALQHRGPDDYGLYESTSISLAFRRLSIIDIAGGHQPMTTQDRRYTVVFNGEIYNFRELRQELLPSPAYDFLTASDTEVVLFAFALWGPEAFQRFNGMFAIAIWDSYERQLTLARDRMGKKPLYYSLLSDTLIFASEVKSLLSHPSIAAKVDIATIPAGITYRYVPARETNLASIQAFPPASYVQINADAPYEVVPHSYWSPTSSISRKSTSSLSDPAAVEHLHSILTESVKCRLVADVPVGAFLSGGVDSSLITALASQQFKSRFKTFSIGFDTGFSEHQYAQIVSRAFDTDHNELIVSADDLLDYIPATLWHRETPISEPSDIPIFMLSAMASKNVKVVLSGEGSDEVFAGYPKYRCFRLMNENLRALLRVPSAIIATALPGKSSRIVIAASAALASSNEEFSARWFGGFSERERTRLLVAGLIDLSPHSFTPSPSAKGLTHIQQMQHHDLSHWLPANLLLRTDRMTMAHGLELRCPFLDSAIVEFGLHGVSDRQKVRGRQTKWIVNQLAKKLLPDAISNRSKWGFKVPVKEWLRGSLSKSLKDTLLSDRSQSRGYFQYQYLHSLIDDHQSGKADHSKQLWYLYQLELWHLMFIDGQLKKTDSLR